jgi:hypothetical protein
MKFWQPLNKNVGRWFTPVSGFKGMIVKIEETRPPTAGKKNLVIIDVSAGGPGKSDDFFLYLKNNKLTEYKPTDEEIHIALRFIFENWWALE